MDAAFYEFIAREVNHLGNSCQVLNIERNEHLSRNQPRLKQLDYVTEDW